MCEEADQGRSGVGRRVGERVSLPVMQETGSRIGQGKVACFFAKVDDPAILERVEFYAQDIRILRDLGFEVRIATKLTDLAPADLYFVWWWTWAFFPVTYARSRGKPVVISGTMNWHVHGERNRLHRWMIERSLRRADANIFVSQLELARVTADVEVSGASYSPHTYEEGDYYPADVPEEKICLSVAWTGKHNAVRKCVPEIIDAAVALHADFPDLRFLIAGLRGDGYADLQARIDAHGAGDYVEFLGVVSKEEKIRLMRACSVYLSPSRFEGFGLAILEAMACGACVVTSPVGAVPEVVGAAGVLVDGTDVDAIRLAVTDLLRDPERRASVGQRAAARAKELFKYERRLTDLGAVIAKVLHARNAETASRTAAQ